MQKENITPLLKWAGGKTQLIDEIKRRMPETYGTYYEPFVGSGAVLFAIQPKRAVINDANPQLINLFRQVKAAPNIVFHYIEEFDAEECTEEFYYCMRNLYNEKIQNCIFDPECAALMLWVNKHCFNGIYRVNSKGLFNVPYNKGRRKETISKQQIFAVSDYLNRADIKILSGDFEVACDGAKDGDFVYLDSPYIPESETAYFTSYTKNGFDMEDHERVAMMFRRLDRKGVRVMASNNDIPLVRELYKGFEIESIDVKRMINSKGNKRKGKEVIIKNYT